MTMLEIRLNCEHCDKNLPNYSSKAMICSYECTFCSNCVDHVLKNVCPNCCSGFEKRPTRPENELAKHPARKDKVLCAVSDNKYLDTNLNIDPRKK